MKLKVTVLTSAVLLIILVALDSFIYFTISRHLYGIEAGTLNNKLLSVESSLQTFGAFGRSHSLFDRLQTLTETGQTIAILDPSGQNVVSSGLVPIEPALAAFHPANIAQAQAIKSSEGTFMSVSAPLLLFGSTSVAGYIMVVADIGNIQEYMHTLLNMLIIGSLGGIALAALGGYIVSKTAVRPLNQMIHLVDRIQANHMSERVSVPRGRDEIARLASTFNRMLSRIERSFQQQSRFVADASHEIRTPLTTIQGYASLLARWGKDDPKVLDKAIQVIHKESVRLRDLANALLTLASLEAESSELPKQCNVKAVVDDIFDEQAPLHPALNFHKSVQGSCQAAIPPVHLKQVLVNLIDNAIKYTPEQGQISVKSLQTGDRVSIQISDTGRGIPSEDLPHIFERFYRVDKARTRRAGGSGLGLAIVKELVELYGGTIEIHSKVDEGTSVHISLPVWRES